MNCDAVRRSPEALGQTSSALTAFKQKEGPGGRYLVVVGSKQHKHLEYRKLGFIEWLFRQFGFGPSRPRKIIKELVRAKLYEENDAVEINKRNAGIFGFGKLSIQKIRAIARSIFKGSSEEDALAQQYQEAVKGILNNENPRWALSEITTQRGVKWVLDALEAYKPTSEEEKIKICECYDDLATSPDIRIHFEHMERIAKGLESLVPLPSIPSSIILDCGFYCTEDPRRVNLVQRLIKILLDTRSHKKDAETDQKILSFFDRSLGAPTSSNIEGIQLVIEAIRNFEVQDDDERLLRSKLYAVANRCGFFAKYHLSDGDLTRFKCPASRKENHFALGKQLLEALTHFLTTAPGNKYLEDKWKFWKTEEYIQEIAESIKGEVREGVSLDFKKFLLTLKSHNIEHVNKCVDAVMADMQSSHPNPTVREAFKATA